MTVGPGEGVFYSASSHRKSFKQDTKGHKWMVIAVFTLSRDEILKSVLQTKGYHLDMENLASFQTPTCQRCEIRFEVIADHPCPGDPVAYNNDGSPIHIQGWVADLIKEYKDKNG